MLREMTLHDVAAVLDVQEPAAVAGLAGVFPQDVHPFPRDSIGERWHAEIADEGTECLVILRNGKVAGFAALRADEVLHFGVALQEWGTGLSGQAHDAIVERMRTNGVRTARLRVYAANPRGRRFWEKHGWEPTGQRSRGSVPPYAELLTYLKQIDRNPA